MTLVRPDDALATYRYVRVALVALVAFLGASVIDTRLHATCWQGSISAYFYTTSHAVFVASLCAVGVCLVVHQGSTRTEDMLLNFAGVLAFAVALVPTGSPVLCGDGLPTPGNPTIGVDNNIRALLIAIAVGIALYVVVRETAPDPPSESADPPVVVRLGGPIRSVLATAATVLSWIERVLPFALGLALVAYFGLFLSNWDFFLGHRHDIAAITMFLAIIVVVLHYAAYAAARRRADTNRRRYVTLYLLIALAMIVALVLAVALEFWSHPLGVLIVEAVLIAAFGVFWIVQSFDLWRMDQYPVGSLSEMLRALTEPG